MAQSMSSTGGRKQAGGDRKSQPEGNSGQKLSDQQPPKPEKGDKEGGVQQGSRRVR
jgi:hypothetical protein